MWSTVPSLANRLLSASTSPLFLLPWVAPFSQALWWFATTGNPSFRLYCFDGLTLFHYPQRRPITPTCYPLTTKDREAHHTRGRGTPASASGLHPSMVDLAHLKGRLHSLNAMFWCVCVLRLPPPFHLYRTPFCRLRRSYAFYNLATTTTTTTALELAPGAQAESGAGVVMVRAWQTPNPWLCA